MPALTNAFGWEPDGPEVVEWFTGWLDLAVEVALREPPEVADAVRKNMANEIDGIWRRVPELRQRIDEIARQLHATAPWVEGWHSLRRMVYLIKKRGEKYPDEDLAGICQLIEHMAPSDLRTRIRGEIAKGWDLEAEDKDYAAAEIRRSERLQLLGRELAAASIELAATGRGLFECEGRSLYPLGTGLAQGAKPADIWAVLRDLHLVDPARTRQTSIFSGFLQQLDESNPAAAEAIRAECRATPALRREYALFLPRDGVSMEELNHVIEIAGETETAAWQLTEVAWRQTRELDDEDRVRLLRAFMNRPDGPVLVAEALSMLRHVEEGARDVWPKALRAVGIDAAVAAIEGHEFNGHFDHSLARVLSYCLRGDDGADANRVMDAIIGRATRRYGSSYDIEHTLGKLAERSPSIFLSRVFPDGAETPSLRFRDGMRLGPLSRILPSELIDWCREDPDRWTRVAPHISPFPQEADGEGDTSDLSPLAAALLDAAPEPERVVEVYLQNLAPMSWSGSRAGIMERRLSFMEALQDHAAPEVAETIARLTPGIRARISRVRQAEQEEDRERDQRFE